MASWSLAVVLIVVVGKPQLLDSSASWEAAHLLIFVTMVTVGGLPFNIALSRRTMDIAASRHEDDATHD